MISKELLSEVLREDIKVFRVDGSHVEYQYYSEDGFDDNINIFELAHKCKEYAYVNGFKLSSVKVDERWCCYDSSTNVNFGYFGDTEPKAIFKACQWILDQKI